MKDLDYNQIVREVALNAAALESAIDAANASEAAGEEPQQQLMAAIKVYLYAAAEHRK